jgi:uroporphyrinogen-III synthase
MNYVLLTRTIAENSKLSQEIELKGINTLSWPLLYLHEMPIDWIGLKKYSHLIVTSKFSAQIIAKNIIHKIKAFRIFLDK